MELTSSTFICDWCGDRFSRRAPLGRKPLYCTLSCRQRAYEDRRARRRDSSWRTPLPVFHATPDNLRRPLYERGGGFGDLYHALRPDGVPDRSGRRPTLCGARVNVVPHLFLPGAPNCCAVCSFIAETHPPRWAVRPSIELPVLRSTILRLADSLGPPGHELVDLARVD